MRIPDRDELLGKLGLARAPSTGEWLAGALIPFGVGMLVGASIALMVAPKSGRELRAGLRSRARRARLSGDGSADAEPGVGALESRQRTTV